MDNDEATTSDDEADRDRVDGESWLAEQARLVLLEDGN
jgi:hypothetical protein